MDEYQEGQTATAKDGRRVIFKGGQWVNYSTPGSAPRAKTTAQDMKALTEASARASAEADAQRDYGELSRAVKTFDTGPSKGMWTDAFLPNPTDGYPVLDEIGALVGSFGKLATSVLPKGRKLLDDDLIQARDRLNTAASRSAVAASSQMKGAASDRDMALLRSSGVSTGKTVPENLRIIGQAQMDSKRSQTRALLTNKWIAKYGSLAQASPGGMTFEQAVGRGNQDLENQTRRSSLPKAPPSRSARPTASPSSGWSIQEVR